MSLWDDQGIQTIIYERQICEVQMYTTGSGNDCNLNTSRDRIQNLMKANLNQMRFIQTETNRMNGEYEQCLCLERMYKAQLAHSRTT